MKDEEIRQVIRLAKPSILLVDRPLMADVDSIPVLEFNAISDPGGSIPAITYLPDDRALVLFTSGTTGEPKGVVLSFQALSARIRSNIAAIGKENLADTLVTLPLHFGHGLIGNTLTPLIAGGNITLHSPGLLLAQNLHHIIDEYGITFMSSVPAIWRVATRTSPPTRTSLARIHVGSAPLSAELWSDIAAWSRAEVVNCYGLTETANWVAGASSHNEGIAEGLLGKPWGSSVAVLCDDGTIRGAGEGEILVKSPAVMSGYLNRPDLTEAALAAGWLHTGDRGRVDDRGIWFAGRIKDEINRAGFKIQPAEIDAILERHPAVAEACVFGISDSMSGEAVAAAIRLSEGATASATDLQSWCLRSLRREAVPDRWFFVDEIPRTRRGKVSRDVMRQTLAVRQPMVIGPNIASVTGRIVDGCVRKAVERAWCAVFGRNAPAGTLTLEAAGADSINILQLWLHLEKEFGFQIPLELLFTDSFDELIIAIEHHLSSRSQLTHTCNRLVFFLPPREGDSPTLARFRARCGKNVRFVTIRYPSWRELVSSGEDFEALIDTSLAQIRAEPQPDSYFLLGYSFGGHVAYEVARRLVETGNRIGFLGLIDTQLESTRPYEGRQAKTRRILKKVAARPHHVAHVLWTRLIEALTFIAPRWSLISIGRLANMLPAKLSLEANIRLTSLVRTRAFRKKGTIRPLDVPTILFRSEGKGSADYGWSGLCRQLKVVIVSGTHLSVLDPRNFDKWCSTFLDALNLTI
jgi:acyl-coenzyme A synthetase/AMP-(fatty) acid ligase/thioesterase domain-containing protein